MSYEIEQKYGYSLEEMFSSAFYSTRTEQFFEFYRSKMLYPNAKPNVVHSTLASLEKAGKLRAVIRTVMP